MEQTKRYFNLDDYVGVPERIEAFWKDYPNGSIVTEVLENTSDHSLIKASVRKDKTTSYIDSTGHAEEPKNKEKQLNKCETVAVGRALALIGYEVKKGIASKEEMEGFTDEPVGKNIQEKFKATKTDVKEDLITPPLINLVKVLVNQLGNSEERYAEERKRFGVSSLAELTQQQARTLIEELKKEGEAK